MSNVVRVMNADAAATYIAANPAIDCCVYLEPFVYTDLDGRVHKGEENQGYPCKRVYVHR
jgi:hypothetical protein